MIKDQRIKLALNIKARKLISVAEELLTDLLSDEKIPEESQKAFWEGLNRVTEEKADIEKAPSCVDHKISPMTNGESKLFGVEIMPFGQHQGECIDNVPLEYLLYIDDLPDFRIKLSRYLAGQRVQSEQ